MDWEVFSCTPVRRGDRWPVSYSPNPLLTATWAITCNLSNETLEFVWESVGAKCVQTEMSTVIQSDHSSDAFVYEDWIRNKAQTHRVEVILHYRQDKSISESWITGFYSRFERTQTIWITKMTSHLHNKKNRVDYISFPQVFIILCIVF